MMAPSSSMPYGGEAMLKACSMYEIALGPDYRRLHPTVQRFHRLVGRVQLQGQVRCTRAAHWLGRLLAWIVRAPRREAEGPLRFELDAGVLREHWVRHFPGCTMASTLRLQPGLVVERIGPASLHFRLREQDGALVMDLARMRLLGLPCPRALQPRVLARERGEGGHFCFEVEAQVPGLGRVVGYSGYLVLPGD